MTATEGSKKLPVYIVLDSSAKETPAQFEELEQCFFNIYNGILSNSRIASRIEISLITYGGEAYNPIPLGPVTEVTMPTLRQDYRPKAVLGAALLKVSNMVKMELGSGYYSPVVMILTNGAVTDKPFYKRAINELSGCDFTLLAFFTTAEVAGTEKINLERLSGEYLPGVRLLRGHLRRVFRGTAEQVGRPEAPDSPFRLRPRKAQ